MAKNNPSETAPFQAICSTFQTDANKYPNLQYVAVWMPDDIEAVPHAKYSSGPEPVVHERYAQGGSFNTYKNWLEKKQDGRLVACGEARNVYTFPCCWFLPGSPIREEGKVWAHWLRRDFGQVVDVDGNVLDGPTPGEQLRCLQRFAALAKQAGDMVTKYRAELPLPGWLSRASRDDAHLWDQRWMLTLLVALKEQRERHIGGHRLFVSDDCFLDSLQTASWLDGCLRRASGKPQPVDDDGYWPATLVAKLHTSPGTLSTWAKKAGVATPDHGEKDFKYPLGDVEAICRIMGSASGCRKRVTQEAACTLLNEIEQRKDRSKTARPQ